MEEFILIYDFFNRYYRLYGVRYICLGSTGLAVYFLVPIRVKVLLIEGYFFTQYNIFADMGLSLRFYCHSKCLRGGSCYSCARKKKIVNL